MSSFEPFAELLGRTRRRIQADVVPLAVLGNALRDEAPGFQASAYGKDRLLDLLIESEHLGTVTWRGEHPWFEFRPSTTRRLRSDWYHASTDFSAARVWKIDLATTKPVRFEPDDPRLTAEPERYLEPPDAGAEFQRAEALKLVSTWCPDVREEAEAVLARGDWYSAIDALFDRSGRAEAWRNERQNAIVKRALEWAARYGFDAHRLLAAPRPPSSAPAADQPRAGKPSRSEAEATRALLHRLIDALSDEDVLAFPVPAWCLARVNATSE